MFCCLGQFIIALAANRNQIEIEAEREKELKKKVNVKIIRSNHTHARFPSVSYTV